MKRACFFFAVLLGTLGSTNLLLPADENPFRNLPPGWAVQKSFVASKKQTDAIGKKLGGEIARLSNTILVVENRKLQVNIFDCPTDADARRIRKAILKMKPNPAYCLRMDRRVIEFVGDDIRLIRKAPYVLGFRPLEVDYRISFDMATVDKADYMSFNELSNLFWALNAKPGNRDAKERIEKLSGRFSFGDSVYLRIRGGGTKKNTYVISPRPTRKVELGNSVVQYFFKKQPSRVGVPYISVTATVNSRAFAFAPTGRKSDDKLLAASGFWPCRDKEIIALAGKITKNAQTDEEKMNAILAWLLPGKNIKFGGSVEGSRYGVKRTLRQGYGQCWDFSDLFVTLCRASGVPCRQVGGWLYEQCGHIWAEVLIEGKGWLQVDPTAGMGCGSDYIPYLTTEDGEMPIVYLSKPKIEVLGKKSATSDRASRR